ncbi:MAG: nitroreductase family protein [Gallionellaceae bacterium]
MALYTKEKLQKKDLFETILARRSVRAYASDELDRKTIQTLLEAAVRAPTAMHEEPWAFIVVQDRQVLKQLSDRAKPLFIERLHRSHQASGHAPDIFSSPDFNIFHGAGTLIVICAKPSGPFVEADCWLAAENLMLAACALGLGSCVIGSSVAALNMQEVKAELGIPDEYSAIAPIIVGVPSGETAATARKEPLILSRKQ